MGWLSGHPTVIKKKAERAGGVSVGGGGRRLPAGVFSEEDGGR